jgi:hypothetical protein
MRPSAIAWLLLALVVAGGALANGNVGVGIGTDENDVISISGDGGNNEIEIRYGTDAQGNDVLIIEGKNGTTIQGQPKVEVPLPGGTDKIVGISVSPGDGADKVTVDLSGLPEGKRLEEVEVEDDLQNDQGNDTVTIKNARLTGASKLKVEHEGGSDTTVVEDCDASNLNLNGSEGDEVTVRRCNVDKRIKIDGPHSGITIEDSFYYGLQIKDGTKTGVQPSRSTRVERTTGKKVSYLGAAGDEEVAFVDNEIESVSARLGDGFDLVWFAGTIADKVSLDGGPGEADCFDDTQAPNVIGSLSEKNFELCPGAGVLDWYVSGANPNLDPPEEAVAWRTNNFEIGHIDGPFALPGVANPLGLPVLDPLVDVAPAHWGAEAICEFFHLHDAFRGHGDPAPGPPDTESACGHGVLEYARPDEDL